MPNLSNSTITILGLGLIGGSIAKALKESAPQATLVGYDSDQEALALALAEQVVVRTGDLKECLKMEN